MEKGNEMQHNVLWSIKNRFPSGCSLISQPGCAGMLMRRRGEEERVWEIRGGGDMGERGSNISLHQLMQPPCLLLHTYRYFHWSCNSRWIFSLPGLPWFCVVEECQCVGHLSTEAQNMMVSCWSIWTGLRVILSCRVQPYRAGSTDHNKEEFHWLTHLVLLYSCMLQECTNRYRLYEGIFLVHWMHTAHNPGVPYRQRS